MNNDIRTVRVTPEDLVETLQIINVHFKVAQETTGDEDEATFYMTLMSDVLSGSRFTDDKRKTVDVMLHIEQLFTVWLTLDTYCTFAKQAEPATYNFYAALRDKFAASNAYSSREA